MRATTTIPANTDLPDRVAFGLTARHLLLAAPAAALMLLGVVGLAVGAVPAWVVAPVEIVLAAGALAAVVTNPDGETLDSFVRAAIAHRRSPRREARSAAGAGLPRWAVDPGPGDPAPLSLPWEGIDPDGFVRLGADEGRRELGATCVMRLSSVDLELLSDDELDGLLAGYSALLNTIESPLQFVVRAEPVELGAAVVELERQAAELARGPAPGAPPAGGIGDLARSRAQLLRSLAEGGLLRRTAYCALRGLDTERLADRSARLADGLRRLGVGAVRLRPAELAGLLGGQRAPCGCLPGEPVGGRAS